MILFGADARLLAATSGLGPGRAVGQDMPSLGFVLC